MIEIKVDTSNLETAIAEFARLTRADLGEVIKTQAGILVGHVISITPPGEENGMGAAGGIRNSAKKKGEAVIAADIKRLFPTSRLSPERLAAKVAAGKCRVKDGFVIVKVRNIAETEEDLRRLHQAARSSKTGRTSIKNRGNLAVTRAAVLKAYILKQQARVGLLNAGWLAAARELKTSSKATPAWITRHGAQKGGADVRDRGPVVCVRIFNNQAWFPARMEQKVKAAVTRREAGLIKAMARILDKNTKAAERRMRR